MPLGSAWEANLTDDKTWGREFDAVEIDGVVQGLCVIFTRNGTDLIYAGPIKGCPIVVENVLVALNPIDFAKLQAHVEKLRH